MHPTPDPSQIAERIAARLGAELSLPVDPARILGERLYMRDVLLVCDAHRGGELAELSAAFRAAIEARIAERAARRPVAAPAAAAEPGAVRTAPAVGADAAAPRPAPAERRWFRR